ETAALAGISPAYLSRIEREKENPPKPEIIKELARILAADPDVLFRLSSSTDPELEASLRKKPLLTNLVRYLVSTDFSDNEIEQIINAAQKMRESETCSTE